MPYKILVIDSSEKHRQVLRNFIAKAYPGVELIEHDPSVSGMMTSDTDWSQYHLLIIDNVLGSEDGMAWVSTMRHQPGFPAVIFISSMGDPGSPSATQAVIEAIRLGAENFLFKKGIAAKQLNNSMLSVLKAVGYDPDATIREMPILTPELIKNQDTIEQTLGTGTREIELSMNDTVLEMELAMAMLHGYAEWPFSMRDILSGKARLGKYHVTSYLGKTDNVSTFKANMEKGDVPVILKMLSDPPDKQSDRAQETIGQLKNSLKWNHPNLVRYLDYLEVDGRIVIVQEFLEGRKLSQDLSQKGVTEDQAILFTQQILSGLAYLHEKNVIVRGITPDTLIFRDPNSIVITDLGLISRLSPADDTTMSHSLESQLCYTSPEKVQGRKVDWRSDLYITGVILYEMLAGSPPFHKGSIQDILYAHASQPVPDLPNKEHPMNAVIQGLMKKTPTQRFQSAVEVTAQIERVYGKVS